MFIKYAEMFSGISKVYLRLYSLLNMSILFMSAKWNVAYGIRYLFNWNIKSNCTISLHQMVMKLKYYFSISFSHCPSCSTGWVNSTLYNRNDAEDSVSVSWVFVLRSQFWPSGIVVACVCVSVCGCVRPCAARSCPHDSSWLICKPTTVTLIRRVG